VDTLRELFRYHAWATLRLIDYCMTLPDAALYETAPGTYGTVLETLVHLVSADRGYLGRLPAEQPSIIIREGMQPSLGELRAAFVEQAQGWEALLERGPLPSVTMPAEADGWPETPHAETLLILQALHHGNDHRTQIGTILGVHGREAPDIDGWEYWHAVHLTRTSVSPAQ
jgi:uncharacterized damage-inducible protein DinB